MSLEHVNLQPALGRYLPQDRIMLGKDLAEWRIAMGLSCSDICWLLYMSQTKWGQLIRAQQDVPLPPEIEIIIRVWDQYPNLIPLPNKVTANQLKESLHIPIRALGLYLGKEEVAGSRWIKFEKGDHHGGQQQTPLTQRLANAAYQLSEANLKNSYVGIVKSVAKFRDIRDLLRTGSWKSNSERRAGRIKRLANSATKELGRPDIGQSEKDKQLKIKALSLGWVKNQEAVKQLAKSVTASENKCIRLEKRNMDAAKLERSKLTLLYEKDGVLKNEIQVAERTLEKFLGVHLDGVKSNSNSSEAIKNRINTLTSRINQISDDPFIQKYVLHNTSNWLELNENQPDGFQDGMSQAYNNLCAVVGDLFNGKLKRSPNEIVNFRRIQNVAQNNEIYPIFSDSDLNTKIHKKSVTAAVKWVNCFNRIESLKPLQHVLNDTHYPRLQGADDRLKKVQDDFKKLSHEMNIIEEALYKILGPSLNGTPARTATLFSQCRMMKLVVEDRKSTLADLSAVDKHIRPFVLSQVEKWFKTLTKYEYMDALIYVSENKEETARLSDEKTNYFNELTHILQWIESFYDTDLIDDDKNLKQRIITLHKQLRNKASNVSDSDSNDISVIQNKLLLAQCDQWAAYYDSYFTSRSKLMISELRIYNFELEKNDSALEKETDNKAILQYDFDSIRNGILFIQRNLISLLGLNLNGRLQFNNEEKKLTTRVKRLHTACLKASADTLTEQSILTETIKQCELWTHTFAEVKQYEAQVAVHRAFSDEIDDELLVEKLNTADTNLQKHHQLLMQLQGSDLNGSVTVASKLANKVSKKLLMLGLEPSPNKEFICLLEKWSDNYQQLSAMISEYAVFDGLTSRGMTLTQTQYHDKEKLKDDYKHTVEVIAETQKALFTEHQFSLYDKECIPKPMSVRGFDKFQAAAECLKKIPNSEFVSRSKTRNVSIKKFLKVHTQCVDTTHNYDLSISSMLLERAQVEWISAFYPDELTNSLNNIEQLKQSIKDDELKLMKSSSDLKWSFAKIPKSLLN